MFTSSLMLVGGGGFEAEWGTSVYLQGLLFVYFVHEHFTNSVCLLVYLIVYEFYYQCYPDHK